jgi:hypothetical protein
MMKKQIFVTIVFAVLMYQPPAFAKASEPVMAPDAHPISGLIGDWPEFRAGILDKTKQYDKYSDITQRQTSALPTTLVGYWQMVSRPNKPGDQFQTVLTLKANNTFRYEYTALADHSRQQWQFSGQWEVKNRILMLLIDHSTYPGEQPHDILFWRILHVSHAKLVYVRSGANELMAMTRRTSQRGS